jgi:CelD/BcsL family acetyltransferase involved in cellulose biosynthesis
MRGRAFLPRMAQPSLHSEPGGTGMGAGGRRLEVEVIRTLDPIRDPRWRQFVDKCPDAGIFHHPAWLELLRAQYHYPLLAPCVVNEQDEIIAGLPLAHVKSRITGDRLVCVPFSDLCGPLAHDPDGEALHRLVDAVARQHVDRGVDVEIRSPVDGFGGPGSSFYHHVLSLEPDVEALRSGLRSSVRRLIAKAERSGVAITRGVDRTALRNFYRLHLMTRRRQGVPTQSKRFVERFATLFEQGLGFVLSAEWEGEVIASAVFLTYNGCLTYKYGASHRAYLDKRPNNALFMEAIRWGCENGFHALDFGRTDVDNEGLRTFKRNWGASERVLTYSRLPARSESGSGGIPGLAQTVIRRGPVVTGRAVGAVLYRHFG